MADATEKRINCVKVCFTDRQYIDLNRLAILADRKLPDYIYLLAVQDAYGKLARALAAGEGPQEASDAP